MNFGSEQMAHALFKKGLVQQLPGSFKNNLYTEEAFQKVKFD